MVSGIAITHNWFHLDVGKWFYELLSWYFILIIQINTSNLFAHS